MILRDAVVVLLLVVMVMVMVMLMLMLMMMMMMMLMLVMISKLSNPPIFIHKKSSGFIAQVLKHQQELQLLVTGATNSGCGFLDPAETTQAVSTQVGKRSRFLNILRPLHL